MRQYVRREVHARLRETMDRGEPLIVAGAGIGLVAKAASRAGIDLLMVYNTGPFRMAGHGSLAGYLAYGDSNAMTLELGREILNVAGETPVIGGIGAADPFRDIPRLVDEMLATGFSGITNVPTAGLYEGAFRRHIDATGLGYPREIDLIRLCRDRDVFTLAYAFSPDEARAMAEAGADVIGAHVGLTSGGWIGAEQTLDLEAACAATQAMVEAAKAGRADVLVVAHGGPFEDPASVARVFETNDVVGYLGASSIERLPVERAVSGIVREFKALRPRATAGSSD
jgi:predicted TIM-barrel enzyme